MVPDLAAAARDRKTKLRFACRGEKAWVSRERWVCRREKRVGLGRDGELTAACGLGKMSFMAERRELECSDQGQVEWVSDASAG